MATVLPPPPATTDARLDQELSKAAHRIRLNDVLTGALALSVLTLAYAALVIVLDRYLELPGWVRQLGLGLFAAAFAAVGYALLVRPMRRVVNPRFAARQVERTVPDAKNVIINWVDLRDKNLPATVRAAVGAQAAEGVAEADVAKATESRRIVWLAAAAGLLLAVLAVLFVVFKPSPFLSLVHRTFNPFDLTRIASRTELTITQPEGGDATVTSGETLTIAVHVRGSVPDPDEPNRVRLLVRYNPAAAEYDEVPFEPGESSREWVLKVPQSVIQNGFWYKVAGGDAETAEHRVTVRSKPLVKEYEARYEYPPYTRMQPDVGRGRVIDAYRGTVVTLTAKTNRKVKRGWLQIDNQPGPIPGEVVGDERDSLRFRLPPLTEGGNYRLGFTTADDEASEPEAGTIRVLADQRPRPEINSPAPDDVTLPSNDRLKVDGVVSDDFGVTAVVLKLQQLGPDGKLDPKAKPLVEKKYRDGKPLASQADGSYPLTLDYKDSIPLGSLKGADGQPLPEGTVIAYWLEATDNCDVPPGPNVGKSKVKQVRLGPPVTAQQKKAELDQDAQKREAEEKQHRAKQDQQLKTEKREPPPAPHQPEQQGDKPPPGQPPQPGGEPMPQQGAQPEKGGPEAAPEPKPAPNGAKPPEQPPGGGEPMPNPPTGEPGNTTEPMPAGTPPMGAPKPPEAPQPQPGATPPQPKDPKEAEKAGELARKIEEQSRQPGDARPPDAADQQPEQPPAGAKPAPKPDAAPQPDAKADPKGGDPSEGKGEGNVEKPEPAQTKPQPKAGGDPTQKPADQPTGDTPKPEAVGGVSAKEKEPPKPPEKPQGQPDTPQPSDPGAGRGAQQPDRQPAAEPKPKPDAARGQERPQPKEGAGEGTPQEQPAGGRGSKPADPASSKKTKPDQAPGAEQPKPDPTAGGPMNPDREPAGEKPSPGPGAAGNPDQKPAKEKAPPPPQGELSRETSGRSSDPDAVPAPPNEDVERLSRQADDLASDDPQKRKQAEDKFDDLLGKKQREELQQKARDAKSGDPEKQKAAKKDVDELAKKAAQAEQTRQPTPEEIKDWQQKAQDLASNDPQKRADAERQFDKKIGEQNRKELQKNMQDLQSGDPKRQQEARDRMEQMAQQAAGKQGGKPDPEQMKKWADKAKDLNSNDPEKRRQAEQDFDRAIGEQNRKKLQEEMKNAQKSGDPTQKQEAEKHAGEAAKDAAQKGGRQPSPEEMKKWAERAKDLTSDDKAKREAAEKEFDKEFGKENREKAQQLAKDLKSDDAQKREAARKKLQEMMKDANQQAAKGDKQPSAEELKQLAEKAKDLDSPDQGKREAAEKAVDDAFGKEAREQAQKDLQDPQKREELKKQLDQMAKDGRLPKDFRLGGAGGGQKGSVHKDDPRNRLKTADLQLKTLKENQNNRELQRKLGYTPEEYDRYVKAMEQRVAQLRDEVDKIDQQANQPKPTGPAAINVGEGSGNKKLETRPDGTTSGTGAAGPGTAPPGFSEAQRKFAEAAAKRSKDAEKK